MMEDRDAQALNAEIQERLKYIRSIGDVRSKTDVQSMRLAVEYSITKSNMPESHFDDLPTFIWNSIAELARETREKLAEICAQNNRELTAIHSLMSPDRAIRDDAWLLFRVSIVSSQQSRKRTPDRTLNAKKRTPIKQNGAMKQRIWGKRQEGLLGHWIRASKSAGKVIPRIRFFRDFAVSSDADRPLYKGMKPGGEDKIFQANEAKWKPQIEALKIELQSGH